MIPKIIHYTWFSGDPFPEKIQQCIDSWHQQMPEYEFRLWDMEAIKDINVPFLKEAIKAQKWAYAADFVRSYAVYHYGGIYLDIDVMLYNSLDRFLNDRAFIGKETSLHFVGRMSCQYVTSHCFGAEKGHPFIKDCLDYYLGRHFEITTNEALPSSLRYNIVLMPYVQAEIAKGYGYQDNPNFQDVQFCKEGLTIYSSTIFDPITQTMDSVCRHLALGSWRDEKSDEINYSIKYKLEWRFVAFLQKILSPLHYVIIKIW